MIRTSPRHASVCWNRIGMYRSEQCTAGPHVCPFLSECERMYDPNSGLWDYTHPLEIRQHKPKMRKIKNKRTHAARNKSKIEEGHRTYMVKIGKASRIPIRTNVDEAILKAGLVD